MRNAYRKSRIIEITAAILINALIGAFIYYNVSEAAMSSKAKKAVRRMNFMIEAAYEESSEADKINVSKVDMKECSLNGNEDAYRAVIEKISGFVPVSELHLENISLSGKEYAIFLRASS